MFGANPFRRGGGNVSPALGGSTFGLPPSLRSSAIAYWDLRNNPQTTKALTNVLTHSDFDATTDWTATTASFAVAANVGKFTASAQNGRISQAFNETTGNKYFVKALVKATSASVTLSRGGTTPVAHSGGGAFEILSYVYTAGATGATDIRINDARAAAWDEVQVMYCMVIDLSTPYVIGNEPVKAECDAQMLNYSSTSHFTGTANVVINPNGKYYISDTSGNGRHLKLTNMAYTTASGPQYSASPPCLRFDGVDDYGVRGYESALAPTAQMTLFITAGVSNWNPYASAASLASKVSGGGYALYMNDHLAGGISGVYRRNGAYGYADTSKAAFASGFHTICSAYDGRYINLAIDGLIKATDDAGGSYAIQYANSNGLIIGANAGTGNLPTASYYFAGDIFNIAVFNRALTTEEIRLMHNRYANLIGRAKV